MLNLRRPRLGALNLVLLVALLALVGGGAWLVWGKSDTSQTAATTTTKAITTDVTSTVSADGTVAPNDSSDVSFNANGIISDIAVEVGDTVAVGSSSTGSGSGADNDSGNVFATIADLSSWVVECSFAEADVAKVKEGDTVQITFGAVPNETFEGRVRKIDLSATTSENVTTYGVEVDVLNAPSELRDGASANVTVTTASATDVLAVPTSAITTDSQGQSTVKLVTNGKSTSRTVQVGIKGDTYTQITSGLKVGDTVELGATSTSSSDTRGRMGGLGGPGGAAGGAPPGGAGR